MDGGVDKVICPVLNPTLMLDKLPNLEKMTRAGAQEMKIGEEERTQPAVAKESSCRQRMQIPDWVNSNPVRWVAYVNKLARINPHRE